MKMSPQRAFHRVVGEALFHSPMADSRIRGATLREVIMAGNAPDQYLPGRLVESQPDDVREALRGLTSDMTVDRDDVVFTSLVWANPWRSR